MNAAPRKAAIAAVGPGRMGRGIAHVFAYAGHPVTVVDLKERDADGARRTEAALREEIDANLRFLASLGILDDAKVESILGRVAYAHGAAAETAIAQAEVIFEGVPEVLDVKAEVLRRVAARAAPEAVIASTTSTILVTELAGHVARPGRFLNAHFLNPAYLIPLVELSAGPDTDEAAVARLEALLEAAGKVPVRCAPTPGYIVPRLQSLLMSEAARMIHQGVATPADIDKAITHGFGPRYATMGVVEFIDWGGVDIMYYAGHYLSKALASPGHRPPDEVDAMMADGRRGLREGQGYYDFRGTDVETYKRETLARFVALLSHLGMLGRPVE